MNDLLCKDAVMEGSCKPWRMNNEKTLAPCVNIVEVLSKQGEQINKEKK